MRRTVQKFSYSALFPCRGVEPANPGDPIGTEGVLSSEASRDTDGDGLTLKVVSLAPPHPTGGYDQVQHWPNGNLSFLLNDELHRIGGPAFVGANGSMAWLQHGQETRIDGPAVSGPTARSSTGSTVTRSPPPCRPPEAPGLPSVDDRHPHPPHDGVGSGMGCRGCGLPASLDGDAADRSPRQCRRMADPPRSSTRNGWILEVAVIIAVALALLAGVAFGPRRKRKSRE